MMNSALADRVILVTGASGIAGAGARLFAASGLPAAAIASVIKTNRSPGASGAR